MVLNRASLPEVKSRSLELERELVSVEAEIARLEPFAILEEAFGAFSLDSTGVTGKREELASLRARRVKLGQDSQRANELLRYLEFESYASSGEANCTELRSQLSSFELRLREDTEADNYVRFIQGDQAFWGHGRPNMSVHDINAGIAIPQNIIPAPKKPAADRIKKREMMGADYGTVLGLVGMAEVTLSNHFAAAPQAFNAIYQARKAKGLVP